VLVDLFDSIINREAEVFIQLRPRQAERLRDRAPSVIEKDVTKRLSFALKRLIH
jgi:hypothetical protein